MKNMLSACLIIRNEECCIEKCLKSIRSHVDEIVVADTGSTDRSAALARKYADKVINFKWANDFSIARNFSVECAEHDWVIVLDADETVTEWDENTLGSFINEGNRNKVGSVKVVSAIDDGREKKKIYDRINRLFNRQYYHFAGSIHEQVTALNGSSLDRVDVDITLSHEGYTDAEINRKDKTARNITLLKQALGQKGDDCYLLYQLGKSYVLGKNNIEARKCFTKAISLIDNFNYVYVRELVTSYGYSLVNSGDIKGAMELEKYRDYYAASPDYNFLLAYIYMMNGMFSKAVETFSKCTEQKNGQMEGVTDWLPLYNIGVIFECLGKRAEALQYYGRCGKYKKALERIAALNGNNN